MALLLFAWIVPTPATADDEEKPIIDEAIIVPGMMLNIQGSVGTLGSPPSTPFDSFTVHAPFPDLNFTFPGFEKRRACAQEDDLGFGDIVACEIVVKETLTAPCDVIFSALRTVPVLGGPLADRLETIAQGVDENLTATLRRLAEDEAVPEEIRRRIANVKWDNGTRDLLVHCSGSIQSVQSLLGIESSNLTIGLGFDIPICPWPEVIPYCDTFRDTGNVSRNIDREEGKAGRSPCSFRNLTFDCGTVPIDNETSVDPFAPWNDLVENLTAYLQVDLVLDSHDRETPGTTGGGVAASDGALSCATPGVPPNSGELPGSWGLRANATVTATSIPPGIRDQINEQVVMIFDRVNWALAEASSRWSETMNGAVKEINRFWQGNMTMFHENGGGRPSDAHCVPQQPQTETQIPQIERPEDPEPQDE